MGRGVERGVDRERHWRGEGEEARAQLATFLLDRRQKFYGDMSRRQE